MGHRGEMVVLEHGAAPAPSISPGCPEVNTEVCHYIIYFFVEEQHCEDETDIVMLFDPCAESSSALRR